MWFIVAFGLLFVVCELVKEYPVRSMLLTGTAWGLSMGWSAYYWLKTLEWYSPSVLVALPSSMQIAVISYIENCEYRGVSFLMDEFFSMSFNLALGIVAFVVMISVPTGQK